MFLVHSGWTPLHLAARAGNADIVRMLLSCNGIDVDARTDKVFLFFTTKPFGKSHVKQSNTTFVSCLLHTCKCIKR